MNETKFVRGSDIQYNSIGGWLIIVAIGLVISPVLIFSTLMEIIPVFSDETWSVITTPGTEYYHPLLAPYLIYGVIGNIIYIVFLILVAILFFQRRRIVPKLIIIYLISYLIFIAGDHFGGGLIPIISSQDDSASVVELIGSIMRCLIWVPYFKLSKRVRRTFVN